MATYISSTEEEARKKRAAESPMTSLTSKTIQAPKVVAPTTTTKTVAAPVVSKVTEPTTTVAKPSTTLTATPPKTTTTTQPVSATPYIPPPPPPPVYGTTQASAQPVTAATVKPVNDSVLGMINGGTDSSSGGGGVSMADSGLTKEDPIPPQQDGSSGSVTAMNMFDDARAQPTRGPRAIGSIGTAPSVPRLPGFDLSGLQQKPDPGSIDLAEDVPDDQGTYLSNDAADQLQQDEESDIDDMLEDFVRSGLSGDEYDDVEINADPYKDVSINHKTDREMDAASRKNIMNLLGYDEGDTGDEERYIEQRVADRLGQQLVGSRASMGRAGFGSSGALYGMEGDQRRQANLDAEGRIYDVREREQNQAFDRNMAGAGLADDRDERLYDRATDNAEVDFRNQDERYGRATDAADNDYRNQTTEFGQKMDVAGLDQDARQGARQDAILKSQMDAINAMLGSAGDDSAAGPPDSGSQDTPGAGLADEDRMPLDHIPPGAVEAPYSEGSSYVGSTTSYDVYVNSSNQPYLVRR